jgi:hypothetical protein
LQPSHTPFGRWRRSGRGPECDKVIAEMKESGGQVIQISRPDEDEAALTETFDAA